MKHVFAIFGAAVGAGIAALISPSWLSLTMGVGFGIFLGYFAAGLAAAPGTILHEDFARLGTLTGRSLDEIVRGAGPYQQRESCTITDRDNAPGFLCTWSRGRYLITLLFDSDSVCLGVTREVSGQ